MPRPRRPHLTSAFDRLFDGALAEVADLEPDDPDCLALKDRIRAIVDEYCRNVWRPGAGPGRRAVKDRDHLIGRLAAAFHDLSNWTRRLQRSVDPGDPDAAEYADYPRRYRINLTSFLVMVLAAIEGSGHDGDAPVASLLDRVAAEHREPRA